MGRLRWVWRQSLTAVTLNLLCWSFVFRLSPPVTEFPFPEEQTPAGTQFDSPPCADCPAFSAFGRDFGSHWDLLPVKVFLAANLPALRAARGPKNRGKSALSPTILLLVSSLQWVLLGAAWRGWRESRRAKRASSPVGE
jgi:hypothetical protein